MDHQLLIREMTREYRKWRLSTMLYGTLYPAIRVYLIVASGLVSAREALAATPFMELAHWVPVVAVTVAIVTALDTWLKPREKWRGFMRDRDDLATLMIRAGGSASQGTAAADDFSKQFARLRRRHRDENVY